MRVALRIAYDGRGFYGHQRQPTARTVEGECLSALRQARIVADPKRAFFRSASRTDRGVSAVGNVIAFDTELRPDAVIGAFNDKSRGVWAWAYAAVPDAFHPRHAEERWYRYHLLEPLPLAALQSAAALFPGEHDFRWFTSEPPAGPLTLRTVEVSRDGEFTVVDVRARSFRRGMIRRIVSGLVGHARGDVSREAIRAALRGERHDFGMVPPEPLVLMEIRYGFDFTVRVKPKVLDEWARWYADLSFRSRLLRDILAAASISPSDFRSPRGGSR